MPKYTLLFCLSLLVYGNSASPYISWRKEVDTAASHQDTRLSNEFNEKMLWGNKEVEPLKDMDLTEADIEPSMLIWKAAKQSRQHRYKKPEEDKDGLYHPSDAQLTAGNKQPDAYFQPQDYSHVWVYEEAEEDMDDLHHKRQGVLDHAESEKLTGELLEPQRSLMHTIAEADKDDLYHREFPRQGSELEVPLMQDLIIRPKTVYTEPEEDLDGLYHS